MSGSLASLVGRTDLAASVLQGAFGAAAVVLNDFEFTGYEVPEMMPFGGGQQITTHKLPGGQRVLDAMGQDPRGVDWQGVFLSVDAVNRAQQVDAIRKAGQPVPLSWGDFYYLVLVSSFEADYRQQGHVPYRICCVVLQDLSEPSSQSQIGTALQVYSDVSAALSSVGGIVGGPPKPASDLAAAQDAADGNDFKTGSADYVAAMTALRAAQASTAQARDDAGASAAAIAARAPAGGFVGSTDDLSSAVRQAGLMSVFATAAGYAGRAVANGVIGAV